MSFWKLSFCVIAVLALAGRAEAACENEHRVLPANSACMSANHTNGWYRIENACYHEIRAKVDVANARDVTRTLDPAGGSLAPAWVEGTISTALGAYIRAVSCCSDHSNCN